MFKAAGLVMAEWTPAEPTWAAPEATDIRRAWKNGPLTAEAGALRGKPTWFRLVPEWRRPVDISVSLVTTGRRFGQVMETAIAQHVPVGGALLARRNLRQGRSDRRGASRLAGAYLALGAVVVLTQNTASATQWLNMLQRNFANQLFIAALIWMFYLAVEPYVRRLWPGTLVAWTRLLEGQLRDPLVGRHILFGALAGVLMSWLSALPTILSRWSGMPEPGPPGAFSALTSTPMFVQTVAEVLQESLFIPVFTLVGLLTLRVIFRRPWIAYALYLIVGSTLALGGDTVPYFISVAAIVAQFALILAVATRLGLFAFLVMVVFSSSYAFPLTINSSSWFFPESVATMLIFAAIAGYGFWVSLGGQKVIGDLN
jgi:serine/threonine-protein kinase